MISDRWIDTDVGSAVGAGDVVFELVDGFGLGGDDPVDEVADGDDAGDLLVLQDGQVANAQLGHEAHAILDGLLGGDGGGRGGDEFGDAHLGGGTAFEGDVAGVFAFGHEADELVAGHDEEGADVVVGHEAEAVEDGGLGGDRVQADGLGFEEDFDGGGHHGRAFPGVGLWL